MSTQPFSISLSRIDNTQALKTNLTFLKSPENQFLANIDAMTASNFSSSIEKPAISTDGDNGYALRGLEASSASLIGNSITR